LIRDAAGPKPRVIVHPALCVACTDWLGIGDVDHRMLGLTAPGGLQPDNRIAVSGLHNEHLCDAMRDEIEWLPGIRYQKLEGDQLLDRLDEIHD
jgi:hypothetical protein